MSIFAIGEIMIQSEIDTEMSGYSTDWNCIISSLPTSDPFEVLLLHHYYYPKDEFGSICFLMGIPLSRIKIKFHYYYSINMLYQIKINEEPRDKLYFYVRKIISD